MIENIVKLNTVRTIMQNKLKYRKDLKRPLTSGEVDANFEFLAQAVSGAQFGIKDMVLPNAPAPIESGQYPVKQAGVYLGFKDSNGQAISVTADDFKTGIVYIIYNGTYSYKFIAPIPLDGEVAEGDMRGVSGSEVFSSLPKIKTVSLLSWQSIYVKNAAIASNGKVVYLDTGQKSIVDYPLKSDTTYTIGNFKNSANKYFALVNSKGDVNSIENLKHLPKTFTTDEEYVNLRVMLRISDELENNLDWRDFVLVEGGVLPFKNEIKAIDDMDIQATSLSLNNVTPNPLKPENAINKDFFDKNSLSKKSLEIIKSDNMADKRLAVFGIYIANDGKVVGGVTNPEYTGKWVTFKIPLSEYLPPNYNADNMPICINYGNFSINTAGYSAFYADDTLLINNGPYSNKSLPKKHIIPSGANVLYVTVARPVNIMEDWGKTVINVGNEIIEYVEPVLIDKIDGIPLVAKKNKEDKVDVYDQSLNTIDNVEFASIETTSITTSVLMVNLPTSPIGLPANRAWIDKNNENVIKVTE